MRYILILIICSILIIWMIWIWICIITISSILLIIWWVCTVCSNIWLIIDWLIIRRGINSLILGLIPVKCHIWIQFRIIRCRITLSYILTILVNNSRILICLILRSTSVLLWRICNVFRSIMLSLIQHVYIGRKCNDIYRCNIPYFWYKSFHSCLLTFCCWWRSR